MLQVSISVLHSFEVSISVLQVQKLKQLLQQLLQPQWQYLWLQWQIFLVSFCSWQRLRRPRHLRRLLDEAVRMPPSPASQKWWVFKGCAAQSNLYQSLNRSFQFSGQRKPRRTGKVWAQGILEIGGLSWNSAWQETETAASDPWKPSQNCQDADDSFKMF